MLSKIYLCDCNCYLEQCNCNYQEKLIDVRIVTVDVFFYCKIKKERLIIGRGAGRMM